MGNMRWSSGQIQIELGMAKPFILYGGVLATRSLKKWRKQMHQQVQVLWECKRDIFEFHVAQCTTPGGTKHTKTVGGAIQTFA